MEEGCTSYRTFAIPHMKSMLWKGFTNDTNLYGKNSKETLEKQALGFIHLGNYDEVIDLMIQLIKMENYEKGKRDGRDEMYGELARNGKLKKEKKNAKTKRTN